MRPFRWGNPYRLPKAQRGNPAAHAAVVAQFRAYLQRHRALVAEARRVLRGWDLACACPLDLPCHADIWLEIANPV